MNFNFNHRNNKFPFASPFMRHFSTISLVSTKPEPDYILNSVKNNVFSAFEPNLANKAFSNPNFVNKQNPSICAFKLSPENLYTPQKYEESSQNCPESVQKTKKIRNRNRKNKKRQKSIVETNMTAKKNCSSPKKFKKTKKSKKAKPWHKISFDQEIIECDESILTPVTADDTKTSPKEGFCFQIKSAPIEITPKCNGAFSISFSSNSSSDVLSCSPSSPALRRLRVPSECDSEDSFIVFCDDTNDCFTESEESDSESEETGSEFEVDFKEKTDLNGSPPKKKVTFANDEELCTVHPMVQWGYAYHAARRGPWEEIARDRARFETRVSKTANVLNAVLDPEHRARIYQNRFQEFKGCD